MLLKQTALALGLAVSSCFAATFQKCGGFLDPVEGSKYTPSLRIRTGKNDGASILVFELKDSLYTNIDINGIDDSNLLNSTNNNFFLCTQEFLDAGKCEELNTFNLEIKEEQQMRKQILNKRLKANQYTVYEIDAKGVYCVAAYSNASHNLEIVAMQSFGSASLEDHYKLEFLKYLVIPASVIASVVIYMSLRKTSRAESPLEYSIFGFSALVTFYNIIKFTNLELSNNIDITTGTIMRKFMKAMALSSGALLQMALLCVLITSIYCLAMGANVLKKKTNYSFDLILLWWFSNATISSCSSRIYGPPSFYYDGLVNFLELIFFYVIHKRSQETLRQIEVLDVKRRFRMSILASLAIPLFLVSTSIVTSTIIGSQYGMNSINSFNPWKNEQKALPVEVLEQTLMSRELIYLSSWPDLVFVGLSMAYALIWFGNSPEQEKQETTENEEPETPKKLPMKMKYFALNLLAMICVSQLIKYLENSN